MKRFYLLIILLLAGISKAAGQSAVHKPTDLVVTAEIVHAVKSPEQLVNAPQLIPYLRLSVRNKTNHPRDVIIMSCSWGDSWVQKGAYGLCNGWICDKNIPEIITIPVGQVLVFYGLQCSVQKKESRVTGFSMGFVDYSEAHFWPWHNKKEAKQKAYTVYWSNKLNGEINLVTTPEIIGNDLEQRYYVSEGGK